MTRGPAVTVITGGTRGIGAATARRLAGPDVALLLTFVSRTDEARALATDLRGDGGIVETVRCDLADPGDIARVFERADDLGPLRGLVNNAGILERQCRFAEIDPDRWRRVFAVNVFGAAEACRHAVARMSTTAGGRGGAIVNVSSRAAQWGSPGEYVDYAASKAALDTLTRGLALEVAGEGVRVNAVRPGIIDTAIHASGGDPDRARRLGPALPMGRAGRPEEVAEAVVWLLSDAASFVTATTLDVGGGR